MYLSLYPDNGGTHGREAIYGDDHVGGAALEGELPAAYFIDGGKNDFQAPTQYAAAYKVI